MRYLVDTNIPSEFTRQLPEQRVADFVRQTGTDNLFLSVLTIGEIRKGIDLLPSGQKKNELVVWLETDVRLWFAGRILPVTEQVAEKWGALAAESKKQGKALSVIDGLIAATAIERQLSLITRNTRDFAGLGLTLINPWDAP